MNLGQLLDDFEAMIPEGVRDYLAAALVALIATVVAVLVHRLVFRIMRRLAHASETNADNVILEKLARPTRYALVALGLVLAAREIDLLDEAWQKIAGFVMPALIGWIILSIMQALMETMSMRADITVDDNQSARRRRTRLAIFSRIGTFIIIFITVGLMLLSIPGVREIGVTLMASAGLAGLAVGAAAQPALKSMIAGLQMALTEPIAIDDVVILDGQFGRIEDIKTTYVIVRTWDERRMVVPTVRFLEETFENWTKVGSALIGTVFLHLDPLTEIEPLRAEFLRFVATCEEWDERVGKLQVTEGSAASIEVRMLMSAHDASKAFDLRCAVREHMLAWIRETMPEAVARQRLSTTSPVVLENGGDKDAPAAA